MSNQSSETISSFESLLKDDKNTKELSKEGQTVQRENSRLKERENNWIAETDNP